MTDKRPDGIEEYDHPAGGWGALRAVAVALRDQGDAITAVEALARQNQPSGFDCPGCAWPDPKHTSAFEFCENGVKAVTWEATSKRVAPEFFAEHSVEELWSRSDYWLESQGRLTHPLKYNVVNDRYEAIDWEVAFREIASRLTALADPNRVDFYTSGRASNEAAFLFQLFARQLGTNNFPDCSNMCHEPTSVGLPLSIGVGKGTVTLDDFDDAELIICIGHNPGTNHPRMMTPLHSASRRGARILVINPLKERALQRFEAPQLPIEMMTGSSTPIASGYFQVRVGGDAAALKGVCKALIQFDRDALASGSEPVLDHEFIEGHTAGFEEYASDLIGTTWEEISASSGLAREQLEGIAKAYATSTATIVCYGMGITQHLTGTDNVHQIANLLLLRGNFGKPGAGICPLRGHSNVQGNRTVGITERPSKEFIDRLGKVFQFTPPSTPGRSVVETIAAMRDGRSKALISLGGNLAMASSDTQAAFDGFRKLDTSVFIATKLNRSHLLIGKANYILPCLARTELDVQESGVQAITVEDSMSMVHASRGFLKPASELLKSEPSIIAGLAEATLGERATVDWSALISDYDLVRDAIEATFPEFEGYNERIRAPGGFRLPNAAAIRVWNTTNRKANFFIFAGLEEDLMTDDPAVLRLMSLRSHDQYNTTIYGLNDRYRGVFGRRDVLFANAQDLKRLGFKEGDIVDVVTALDHARPDRAVRGLTVVSYDIPSGCCAAYYPETQPLIALEHCDPQCLTPSYKSVPVKITSAVAGVDQPVAISREGIIGTGYPLHPNTNAVSS